MGELIDISLAIYYLALAIFIANEILSARKK